jgi:hypothetical protein
MNKFSWQGSKTRDHRLLKKFTPCITIHMCTQQATKFDVVFCAIRQSHAQIPFLQPTQYLAGVVSEFINWKCALSLQDKHRRSYTAKYSKSKFSQNTTNLLSIKVATRFDSRSHHQANYWTMYEVHEVKVHTDVPQTWFNNWPDDDSLSRNMSPL